MATVVDTYCSTAKGANSFEMATVWFQRSVLIVTLTCIPVVICFIVTGKAYFLAFGLTVESAERSSEFLSYLAPGLFPAAYSLLIVKYMVIQDVLYTQVLIGGITVGLNILLNYFLMTHVGLMGAPWATTISRYMQFFMLIAYVL